MTIRTRLLNALAAAALLAGAACDSAETGPVTVSAIGAAPTLVNPNLTQLDAASAFLLAATAQGLTRFDPSGQIEPALAQSWTVSDDGLSYIFRIDRLQWSNGSPVTAQQVAARLQAAGSRASRNDLKPLLGAIDEILAMTDRVIEIRLKAPRPNFLQLLAQPEMAIIRNEEGTGPYVAEDLGGGAVRLRPRTSGEDEEAEPQAAASEIILRGERAAMAVARFERGLAALVLGGTAGDLPIARAADPANAALRFDSVSGLFGLAFSRPPEWLETPEARRALSMAIDRTAIAAAIAVPDLTPRASLLPPGIAELPNPAQPAWVADPLSARRAAAAAIISGLAEGDQPPTLRVAMPDLPGYRLLFAHIRRDWRAIGVEAERVAPDERADLVLIDEVAPAGLATWYLRHFTCDRRRVCNSEVDTMLEAARNTLSVAERQQLLASADRLLVEAVPFIPLTAPVRWSLVSERVTGFRTNMFGRHFAGALVAARP
jgi:peptide/nickel transport system substrate-binding protein